MADTPASTADNTTPEEKELADKLMAELKASGVDIEKLQAKKSADSPSTTTATPPPPTSVSPPAPVPAPVPEPVTLEPKLTSAAEPVPMVSPQVPTIAPQSTGSNEENFIQSLDNKLSRLNDEKFIVIRIPKAAFYLATLGVILLVWFWPLLRK